MLRLRKTLADKRITVKGCAEILGVSEKALFNKLSGETEFTYGEVRRLKALLPEYDMDFLLDETPTTDWYMDPEPGSDSTIG